MFALLRRLFGRGEGRAGQRSRSTVEDMQDRLRNAERTPMSDLDTGKALLHMLESDPCLTELSLAASIGQNVTYVHRVVKLARDARVHAIEEYARQAGVTKEQAKRTLGLR